jgi:CRP-like cAMP-binding protein
LKKLRFSASLPADVVSRLASSAVVEEFPAGTVVFREGSRNDRLMIVSAGRIALDMHVPARGETRVLTLGPGDMVAWSAVLGGGHMTTSAVALDDTQVVTVSAADVVKLCESNHDFGYYLMRQMSQALADRLIATRLQLLDLFSEPSLPVSLDSGAD